jgi:hypothetical protein
MDAQPPLRIAAFPEPGKEAILSLPMDAPFAAGDRGVP